MPNGRYTPSTSLWVKDYLLEKGEANIMQVYIAHKKYCKENGWQPPEYSSMLKLFWLLRKLKLVSVREEEVKTKMRGRFIKRIHKVIDPDSKYWVNPYMYYAEKRGG